MTIEIDALDTLIFQSGKPFDKSSDNWGESLILPNPSTIYGALRATYFAQNPDELDKANEENDPTKDLKIKFIGLKNQDNKLLYPLPKDCIEVDENIKVLALEKNDFTNNPLDYIFTIGGKVEKINGYLKDNNFKRYLNNKNIRSYEKEEDYITKESKIGIGLDKKSKTVQEGLLYRVEMTRYKKLNNSLKIVVKFEGLDIEKSGLMRLGAEAKGAFYKEIEKIDIPKIEKISNNRFKLYLLTPAIFKNGWYPSWINSDFLGEIDDIKVKLIASSIGKTQYIGGFDMKKRKPKEMLRAVPAGSVYYFEIIEENRGDIIDLFNLKSISDKLQNEGYGIAMIGDV